MIDRPLTPREAIRHTNLGKHESVASRRALATIITVGDVRDRIGRERTAFHHTTPGDSPYMEGYLSGLDVAAQWLTHALGDH